MIVKQLDIFGSELKIGKVEKPSKIAPACIRWRLRLVDHQPPEHGCNGNANWIGLRGTVRSTCRVAGARRGAEP